MFNPKLWQAKATTVPGRANTSKAKLFLSSSEQSAKACSKTFDEKRCLAKRCTSLRSDDKMHPRWRADPFDKTDMATSWPNLWQQSTATSAESTASTSADVRASLAEYSIKRQRMELPLAFSTKADGFCRRSSSAMKAASSAPTERTICS